MQAMRQIMALLKNGRIDVPECFKRSVGDRIQSCFGDVCALCDRGSRKRFNALYARLRRAERQRATVTEQVDRRDQVGARPGAVARQRATHDLLGIRHTHFEQSVALKLKGFLVQSDLYHVIHNCVRQPPAVRNLCDLVSLAHVLDALRDLRWSSSPRQLHCEQAKDDRTARIGRGRTPEQCQLFVTLPGDQGQLQKGFGVTRIIANQDAVDFALPLAEAIALGRVVPYQALQ